MSPDSLTSLLGNLWSIFLIVLFFGGSIFVHELGHFLAARRRGVRVERFSIGFGPALWKKRGKDGCEYRLSVLPLGGYVALPQLADLSVIEGGEIARTRVLSTGIDSGPVNSERELPPISYATKMIVFVAGAVFNVLFAFILACVLWVVGQQTSEELSTTRIGYVTETIALPDGTTVPSPAHEAGLQIGDTIRAIDGQTVKDWPDMMQTLVTSFGQAEDGRREAIFSIERAGRTFDVTVYPRLVTEDKVRKVGIVAAYTPIVADVPKKSFAETLGLKTGDALTAINGAPLLNLLTLHDALQKKPAQVFTLTIKRGQQTLDLSVPADRPKESSEILGAAYRTTTGFIHTNPVTQIVGHASMMIRVLYSLVHPHSDINASKLSGPVGIGKIFWDASEAGLRYVIWITILVNVNLALFNLLPIPVLDGGQMLFATIGKLRGRALSTNFVATSQSIFMVLLLSLIVYVSVFDIGRIRRDSKADAKAREAAAEQKKDADQPAPAKP